MTRLKTILIVDDSPTMRRMVRASLNSMPEVAFREAGNGLEAIEHLALTAPDLMILDLNMPDMHGIEVLEFIRRHQTYQNLPVLILTTRRDEDSRFQALASGATRYLTKPFKPHELIQQASQLLNRERE